MQQARQIQELQKQLEAERQARALLEKMRAGGGGGCGGGGGSCSGASAPSASCQAPASAPAIRYPGEEHLTDAQVAQKRASEAQRAQQQVNATKGCVCGAGSAACMCGANPQAMAGFAAQQV